MKFLAPMADITPVFLWGGWGYSTSSFRRELQIDTAILPTPVLHRGISFAKQRSCAVCIEPQPKASNVKRGPRGEELFRHNGGPEWRRSLLAMDRSWGVFSVDDGGDKEQIYAKNVHDCEKKCTIAL